MALHTGADRPHLPRLGDDDVCGLARPDAAAARRFGRRAMLYLVILWRAVPKQKPMRQVFVPTGQPPKPTRNPTVGAEDLKNKT